MFAFIMNKKNQYTMIHIYIYESNTFFQNTTFLTSAIIIYFNFRFRDVPL